MDVHSLPRGKERTKKTRPDVPSGTSLSVPLCKEKDERSHISFSCCASSLANTSGRHRKQNVLPKQTHLGRALMRPRWRELAKAKAPAALKKPSGGGVPRGVPLVPFLATSWGMPRSSIKHSAPRCGAPKGQKTKFQAISYYDIIPLRVLRHCHIRQAVAVKTLKKCHINSLKF